MNNTNAHLNPKLQMGVASGTSQMIFFLPFYSNIRAQEENFHKHKKTGAQRPL